MNILCPNCRQALAIDEAGTAQVRCPACSSIIDVSAVASGQTSPIQAAGTPSPGPGVQPDEVQSAQSGNPGLHTRLRRQAKHRTKQRILLAAGLFLLLGVAAAISFAVIATAPKKQNEEQQMPLVLIKAQQLLAKEFPLGVRFSNSDSDYIIHQTKENIWSIKSYVYYPDGNGLELRQGFLVLLQRERNDRWRLVRLEVGGRHRMLKHGRSAFRANDREDPSNPDFLADAFFLQQDRTVGRAVRRFAETIQASLELRQTLVVWLFDVSPSATRWRKDVLNNFDAVLAQLQRRRSGNSRGKEPLQMAVLAFDSQVHFLTEQPASDPTKIRAALDRLAASEEGSEKPFLALEKAAEKFGEFRQQGGYLQFVVVTDEAGNDDEATVENVTAKLRRLGSPVYVIGKEAPFGRHAWPQKDDFNASSDPLLQGPESLYAQRIGLDFWQSGFFAETKELPSGFGPYALSRLCRKTGGTFFACQRGSAALTFSPDFIGGAIRRFVFDPKIRGRYAPRYISAQETREFIDSNGAAKALHQAAKVPFVDVAAFLQYEFEKKDEASLARLLREAQKGVAKVEPKLNALYDLLKPGEKDRSKLSEPRWQAGFDLAMGRVLAGKSRMEGYNSMLAALKQGRKFKNPGSTTWVLKPSDMIAAGSKYERTLREAQTYLERIVKEHPGTPWAFLAERELAAKLGWEWSER